MLHRHQRVIRLFRKPKHISDRYSPILILRLAWINFIDPVDDTAREVEHLAVTLRSQEIGRIGAAGDDRALHDELVVRVELDSTFGDIAQRNQQRAIDLADLIFVRLANIDDRQFVRDRAASSRRR
jgi:hypothetical protein